VFVSPALRGLLGELDREGGVGAGAVTAMLLAKAAVCARRGHGRLRTGHGPGTHPEAASEVWSGAICETIPIACHGRC